LSFRDSRLLLGHILDAIALIEDFISGMDFEAFRSNPMAMAAVERKLLIISEAAVPLGGAGSCTLPWHSVA
jgi:uncharacterized protein with HEPN domain